MAFKPRLKANGAPCCYRKTDDGRMAFPRTPPCAPCREYFDAVDRRQEARAAELRNLSLQENRHMTDLKKYEPVDPYAAELAVLRAASATPMSRFEERFAAERAADFERQHREFATFRAAQQPEPRLTAAELAKYEPPNPYRDALLKEKR
jgi:hypothetical protein